MALDNFWQINESQNHPIFNPPLTLQSSKIKSSYTMSFKGHMYLAFFMDIMELDLYKNEIPTEELSKALLSLNSWIAKNPGMSYNDKYGTYTSQMSNQEILDLQRMITAYIEVGGTLAAWW